MKKLDRECGIAARISGLPVYKTSMRRSPFVSSLRFVLSALLCFAVLLAAPGTLCAQGRTAAGKKVAGPSELAKRLSPQIEAALRLVADGGDRAESEEALERIFAEVTLSADASELELFRDAAASVRLIRLMKRVPNDEQAAFMQFLLDHMNFARALVFTVRGSEADERMTMELSRLMAARYGDAVDRYAQLATAICVVHKKPLTRRVNENQVKAPDPMALFEYYMANDERMMFGVRHMPADLLAFVVDSTSPIEEMRWALGKYAGHRNVGELFFTIKYDYDHLEGKPKKVTVAGFSLPNIAKFGGVCADQAYFACSVGKAIGVPTAYTRGASGEVSHAWVGFLQGNKSGAWWNFDSGRYDAYKGVRGVVDDPQTGARMADSSVALLAEYATASEINRYGAIALTDAAKRILQADGSREGPGSAEEGAELVAVRGWTRADALALLESALRTCPGYADAWFTVRDLAQQGKLSLDEKKKWATVLHRLCSERYPDFYFAVVAPMIETVEDAGEQNALWNAAFRTFQKRHDLAAAVRMKQAAMWRKHGEPSKAGQCCEDVIMRYANAGPFVLDALTIASELLAEMKQPQRVPALYQKAWSLTKKPDNNWAPEFYRQSNWYRVGERYAASLAQAGEQHAAAEVRAALGAR